MMEQLLQKHVFASVSEIEGILRPYIPSISYEQYIVMMGSVNLVTLWCHWKWLNHSEFLTPSVPYIHPYDCIEVNKITRYGGHFRYPINVQYEYGYDLASDQIASDQIVEDFENFLQNKKRYIIEEITKTYYGL